VTGEVRHASEGRVRLAIQGTQAGESSSIHSEVVEVDASGAYRLAYDVLPPGSYVAKARYLGSRGARSSRSKPQGLEVAAVPTHDGDAGDPGEQSPTFHVATLKREIPGGDPSDGIAPGESIPSHLRTGVYHNPEIDCPPPDGCSVEVDNIEVLEAS
jgi:hypothetical protein